MKIALMVTVLALPCFPPDSNAQSVTAVPFLLMTSSPEGNGMGGISASTFTGNPMAVLANPGQLGLSSLDTHLSGTLYPSLVSLPTLSWDSSRTYMASAINGGIELGQMLKIPFRLGVGFGYAHSDLTGLAYFSGEGPSSGKPVRQDEYTDDWSLALGIDYYIYLGLGYTNKSAVSILAPFYLQGGNKKGIADIFTYDIGVIARIPVTKLMRGQAVIR